MRLRSKAQVSTEVVVAVAVVLLTAVVISVFASQRSSDVFQLSEIAASKNSCERLSSIIYSVSNSNAKARVVFDLDANASIFNGLIGVGEYYCSFLGTVQDSNLSAGRFEALKNSQGVVIFEKIA